MPENQTLVTLHPDYNSMLQNFSFEEIKSLGGYFETDYDPKDKILLNLPKFDKQKGYTALIAISGCFSPFHEGHLNALEIAKKELLKRGFDNVKAIIYPAHDSYVSVKKGGEAKNPISERVEQIKSFLGINSSWIFVDDYPAKNLKEEVNFPYLIDRLEGTSFANRFNHTVFVVGGDNFGFVYAMKERRTEGMIIERDKEVKLDKRFGMPFKNISIIKGDFPNVSSSLKRERPVYLIRDDSMYCGGFEREKVVNALEECLKTFDLGFDVFRFSALKQIKFAKTFIQENYKNHYIISLDKWFYQADARLLVSRHFNYDGCKENGSEALVSRTFKLQGYTQGRKVLVIDDDSVTGSTFEAVRRILNSFGIEDNLIEFKALTDIYKPWGNRKIYDIIDARDFIIGSSYGGLVVEGLGRVNYLHPMIDLCKRMKLPEGFDDIFRLKMKKILTR